MRQGRLWILSGDKVNVSEKKSSKCSIVDEAFVYKYGLKRRRVITKRPIVD